jgi:tetratricopeptide (TPR) repeat protein
MKIFGMRLADAMMAGCVGVAMWMAPARMTAQATASFHGHAQNAAGQSVTSGEVRLTTNVDPGAPNLKFDYTFPVDANGDYKGAGIKPGTYFAILFQGDKHVDYIQAKLTAGDDKTVDFDMTRKEYIEKMSPEEKRQVEEFKKQNAAVIAGNAKIQNLNQLLAESKAAIAAGNPDLAVKDMTDATAQRPTEPILWSALGNAQFAQADAAAKAAHDAKTTDASVPDKYAGAATSYQKTLSLYAAAAKPNPGGVGAANNQLGLVYSKLGKMKEASAAFDAAAAADPSSAGKYYLNEAESLLNANDVDDAAVAADKTIAADPTKANAYYVKGQALVQKATLDPKTGKVVAPPDCVVAYQKYLELAPTGVYADDVKGILQEFGETIKQTYKAPKK